MALIHLMSSREQGPSGSGLVQTQTQDDVLAAAAGVEAVVVILVVMVVREMLCHEKQQEEQTLVAGDKVFTYIISYNSHNNFMRH